MNKIIFVGIAIAIILIIITISFSLDSTSLPNQEVDSVEVVPEVPSEGKDLSISFSDGISALSP